MATKPGRAYRPCGWPRAIRSSWRTPTGNPANPFFLGPLAALHLFLRPARRCCAGRRWPAGWPHSQSISGFAAGCSAGEPRGSRHCCLAVLPLNIAYCRFAWDASQSLLATLLVAYLAARTGAGGRSAAASLVPPLLAFGAAIWVHPTNVFAGCLLGAADRLLLPGGAPDHLEPAAGEPRRGGSSEC